MPCTIPRVWVDKIVFSDGTEVPLKQDDIVVLVGPNNSGKSVALRDIGKKSEQVSASTLVVKELNLKSDGDEESLVAWLEQTSSKSLNPLTYRRLKCAVMEAQARQWWNHPKEGLHTLSKFFLNLLDTEGRLTAANPPDTVDITTDQLTHPIHYLLRDGDIESKVSDYFRDAFGQDLIVNAGAGRKVPLHCGLRPQPGQGRDGDRVSRPYLLELARLPALQSQGDGMRSFVAVLLHSLVVEHSVVLVDEPEAFLHPPQARLLGQMVVREAPGERQFFFATHSGDFLRGLLDTFSGRVRVLRLRRESDINRVTELDSDGVRSVWADPLLRYSNILDGVFHNRVVLCESDSDCMFYRAVWDAMAEDLPDWKREDVMFVHCGGKGRMPIVLRALRRLDVPVRVIVDFDALREKRILGELVNVLGGDWSLVAEDWQSVCNAVSGAKPEYDARDVSEKIGAVLDGVEGTSFPSEAKQGIQAILRRSSPWSIAKATGERYVRSGPATQALKRLLGQFTSWGLFVVRVGELECFDKRFNGHGPRWVNEVLKNADLAADSELEGARAFVGEVLRS